MNESALLMSADATSEAMAGPSDGIPPAQPAVPTWDPVERWRAQRKVAWVLLIDAAIYFVISMVTFALVNIIVSAAGLAAGIAWFVFFFLRFGTQSAIKVRFVQVVAACATHATCCTGVLLAGPGGRLAGDAVRGL